MGDYAIVFGGGFVMGMLLMHICHVAVLTHMEKTMDRLEKSVQEMLKEIERK